MPKLTPCPREDCTADVRRTNMLATHPPHPSDGPPVRVHLTAATLDAAAAVCEVRGLPHLVARLDRAANEIRSQEDMEADA